MNDENKNSINKSNNEIDFPKSEYINPTNPQLITNDKNSNHIKNSPNKIQDGIESKDPIPAKIIEEHEKKDKNDNLSKKKKKEKRNNLKVLKTKNAFCSELCFDDNITNKQAKKCYFNGQIRNCFSCKYKDIAKNEKEKIYENICMNLCNHVENSSSCVYFGYINKNKKSIDIDSKLLDELKLRKTKKRINK